MLAHDLGGSKSANRRQLTHLMARPGTVAACLLVLAWTAVPVLLPGAVWGQLVPDRAPGPRLEVEPPEQDAPAEPVRENPTWILNRASADPEWLERALAAARRDDPEGCLAALAGDASPAAARLAFACQVALGHRSQADALFHQVSWEDGGRSAARLAAWRGIEDGDPFLVRRSLAPLSDLTPGEQAALVWADWHEGVSLEGSLPALDPPGTAGRFVDMARAYQSGSAAGLQDLPAPWRRVAETMQTERNSEARDILLRAYDASLRGEWSQSLAHANRLLALYPNSAWRGQAYLLRGLGRLAGKELELARADAGLARNFLHAELPVPLGLLECFVLLNEGDAEGAQALLQDLRTSPLGRGQEPALLFHQARMSRYQGREEDVVDAVLTLEEAYGDSPWYARAVEDRESGDWGLPVIEIPIPPARVEAQVAPPQEGPFGLVLWGDDILTRTAREVESAPAPREETKAPPPVAQAKPVTRNGARVMAGGGSRDTRYLEWDWIKDDFDRHGFRVHGALTQAQEGSSLPRSDRFRLGGWVRQDRDYGRVRVDGQWDSRTEGENAVQARGATLALGLASSDPRETSGFRNAEVRGQMGVLNTQASDWDYARLEAAAEAVYPALLGDLETAFQADIGVQSVDGDRSVPWLLNAGLYLPLKSLGRVGIHTAVADHEFYLLPSGSLQVGLAGGFALSGSWEPSMEYPDMHNVFMRDGDWNTPSPELAPVVRPVRLRAGLSWQSLRYALSASGTHFRADNFRSWTPAGDGIWNETGLDQVRGYALELDGKRMGPSGWVAALRVKHSRVEQHGERVAFTPTWSGRLELGVPYKSWYYAGVLEGVAGRRDHEGEAYGSYLGLNLEATYHTPLGLAASLRLVNLTNSPVRRWPDKPIFSRGLYAGLGYRFGS